MFLEFKDPASRNESGVFYAVTTISIENFLIPKENTVEKLIELLDQMIEVFQTFKESCK